MEQHTRATVLIVEDDSETAETLAAELRADGYAPILSGSVAGALTAVRSSYPDAAIVDVGLPDGSGLGVVGAVRGAGAAGDGVDPDLPLLVISGRCGESDRVRAFEFGADDFLAKPFSYRELRGRLRALLRRRERTDRPRRVEVGPLAIDLSGRHVEVGGEPVRLTQTEFDLLRSLAAEPQRVFTKRELLRAVWGHASGGHTQARTLDSHVCRLRTKIVAAGGRGLVQTIWGVGYRLCDPAGSLR